MTEQEVKMLEGTFRSDGKRCGCDLNCVLDGKCTGVNRRDRRWARRHGQCAYAKKPVANNVLTVSGGREKTNDN